MDAVMNAVRGEAERVVERVARTRIGIVSSYDPDNYAVKVRLQPENAETGWLPLTSPWVGNGWGLFAPPAMGDQVEVSFLEGDAEVGMVAGRLYSDEDRPLRVEAGEFWLIHGQGAKVRLRNDGSVEIFGADIKIGPENATLLRLVTDAFMPIFNAHQHGNSGPPQPQMGATHLTAALKAG